MPELWRPSTLTEYIGQQGLIDLLLDDIHAAISECRAISHCVFHGPPGTGKTTLAWILAKMRGGDFREISGPALDEIVMAETFLSLDPSGYDGKGYLISRSNTKPAVVYINEAECIPTSLWESMHNILEPGPDGRRIFWAKVPGKNEKKKVWCPALTVIMDTNHYGRLKEKAGAALSRIPIQWQFELYEAGDLITMVIQYAAKAGVRVTAEAASAIAQRSRGTPRTAIQIFERAMARRSALKHRGGDDIDEITQELVEDTADLLQIDEQGLTKPQRDYLQALARSPGGVLGVENLASVLSIDKATIQREIEPHLLRQGFVTVCRGGRQITPEGLDHAGPEHVSPIMKRLA